MNSEMKSAKWLWGGIALQLGVGFTIGYLVYQIGTFVAEKTFGVAFLPGFIAVLAMIGIVVYLCINSEKKLSKVYELKGKKVAETVNK